MDFVTQITKKIERNMSLLPIIYSAILIFSGVLVFVVIVSYVSFKAKGEDEYSEFENKENDETLSLKSSVNNLNNEPEKMKELEPYHDLLKEKNMLEKRAESASHNNKSNKKLNEKNVQVLYRERDLFSRSKPRFTTPRFSVIQDISQHLVNIDNNVRARGASYNKVHVIQVGTQDYLRFYENH
jgi:hypothetical protein